MTPLRKAAALILVVLGIAVPLSFVPAASAHRMITFSSYADLMNYVHAKPQACSGTTDLLVSNPRLPTSDRASLGPANSGSVGYSTTNVQVQGVDELDTVKTDGENIYTITNNTLVVVRAFPASSAQVLSRITPNGTLTGVFVSGNKLVLIGGTSEFQPVPVGVAQPGIVSNPRIATAGSYGSSTDLWVYDISNPASPALTLSLQENGSYVGSRLISNQVYLITTQNAVFVDDSVVLPARTLNGQTSATPPTQIYHSDVYDSWYSFTNVVQVDLGQPSKVSSETFLISTSSTIYVSTGNIYLTSSSWNCGQQTVIHRVSMSNGAPSYQATGTVAGAVLNQFSMDENQGYFRIVTSGWQGRPVPLQRGAMTPVPSNTRLPTSATSAIPQGPSTNVYVLNMDLHTVGGLEGISPGETFYAARFMGNRAYLVTHQRVDPLFVVDLGNPSHPKMLGQLQITGVSDYLQPYDENHLIGFGKSSVNVTWENAALFQGLKLSLFDVTDPTHPTDTSDYLIGDKGSDSPALTDSHAVLFDKSLNLLVIPVEVAKLTGIPTGAWETGTPVWQGAYVFSISPSGGVVFRGGITHLQNGELPSWNNADHFVTRALYIGNILYTLSPAMVRMNSMTDLSELGSIGL